MKKCKCCNTEKEDSYFPKYSRNCNDCQHLNKCNVCFLVKPTTDFYKDSRNRCKKCANKMNEDRKKRNHPEKIKEKKKLQQLKKNAVLKEQRRLNKKPPIRTKEESHSLLRLRRSVHSIFKRWTIKKLHKSYEYLSFSKEQFLEKFPNIPDDMQIDHKIPLSWFKPDTPIYIMFDLNNLQLLTSKDNQIKSNHFYCQVPNEYLEIALPYVLGVYLNRFKTNLDN